MAGDDVPDGGNGIGNRSSTQRRNSLPTTTTAHQGNEDKGCFCFCTKVCRSVMKSKTNVSSMELQRNPVHNNVPSADEEHGEKCVATEVLVPMKFVAMRKPTADKVDDKKCLASVGLSVLNPTALGADKEEGELPFSKKCLATLNSVTTKLTNKKVANLRQLKEKPV